MNKFSTVDNNGAVSVWFFRASEYIDKKYQQEILDTEHKPTYIQTLWQKEFNAVISQDWLSVEFHTTEAAVNFSLKFSR